MQLENKRAEKMIEVTMAMLKSFGCFDKMNEKEIEIIKICLKSIEDGASLDEWHRGYELGKKTYEVIS
jgi:hypothetical protein